MNKLIIIAFIAAICFNSCSRTDQETINKLACEICEAMELYDENNPTSIIEVTKALNSTAEHKNEYTNISETQLAEAMKALCPEGYTKYQSIMSSE